MTYKPVPGTIPYRVIEVLSGVAEMTSAQIAGELDIEAKQLLVYMKSALAHGAVVKELRDGLLRWRLGDGTPPASAVAADDGPDDQPMVHRVVPAAEALAAQPKVAKQAPGASAKRQAKAAKKVGKAEDGPSPETCESEASYRDVVQAVYARDCAAELASMHGGSHPMRCAVWSDGALTIERNGLRMDISPDESRALLQMLRVLDRTIGGEGEG